MTMYADVIIFRGVPTPYTYLVDTDKESILVVGSHVELPFGRSRVKGLIIARHQNPVKNAKSKSQAKNIAFSICNSPLVKTAIAGEDANWGRVVMAIGKTNEKVIQNKLTIKFGNIVLARNGERNRKLSLAKVDKYMKNKLIEIEVNLNLGKYSKTVYGNDLNNEYISINADYRS